MTDREGLHSTLEDLPSTFVDPATTLVESAGPSGPTISDPGKRLGLVGWSDGAKRSPVAADCERVIDKHHKLKHQPFPRSFIRLRPSSNGCGRGKGSN